MEGASLSDVEGCTALCSSQVLSSTEPLGSPKVPALCWAQCKSRASPQSSRRAPATVLLTAPSMSASALPRGPTYRRYRGSPAESRPSITSSCSRVHLPWEGCQGVQPLVGACGPRSPRQRVGAATRRLSVASATCVGRSRSSGCRRRDGCAGRTLAPGHGQAWRWLELPASVGHFLYHRHSMIRAARLALSSLVRGSLRLERRSTSSRRGCPRRGLWPRSTTAGGCDAERSSAPSRRSTRAPRPAGCARLWALCAQTWRGALRARFGARADHVHGCCGRLFHAHPPTHPPISPTSPNTDKASAGDSTTQQLNPHVSHLIQNPAG